MGRYYQKYFEDYEENRVPNKWGNGTHLQYTYKGFYYRQECRLRFASVMECCFCWNYIFSQRRGPGLFPVMQIQ